jgi:RHS repeat-associated protein
VLAPDPPPSDRFCTQNPLRYLTGARVRAYDARGAITDLPSTTFTYNARLGGGPLGPPPFETSTVTNPGLGDYGHEKGAVGTLLDLDSDGLRDRVSVREEDDVCTLVWQKGLEGGRFESGERTSPLPTAPWSDEPELVPEKHAHPARLPDERCTLNGQVSYRHRPVLENGDLGYNHERGVLSYHFLDYTGDGRVDLLTNVWAAIAHETFVPTGDGLRPATAGGGNGPMQMTPEGVWRVYRNAGDPDAFAPSGAVFSVTPFRVDMPAFGGADCAPEALPPSAADNRLSQSHVPDVSISPLTDLDGDGFLDLVDVGKAAGGLRFDGEWCVWFGAGGRDFSEAYRWRVPELRLSLGEKGYNEDVVESEGVRHVKRTTAAALQDMNGDGLADLVVQTIDQQLKTYLSTGSGFRVQPIELGLSSPIDVVQTDYELRVGDVVENGRRGYRLRLLDVDGDRLPDLVTTSTPDDDVAGTARVFVRFNSGDGFHPRVEVPARWAQAQRLLRYDEGEWHLATDFFDADGDGREDLASWATDGSRLTISESPGLPPAADLLKRVENGSGLRISFDYGVSTDPAAVSWNHGAARTPVDLPQPTWVVRAITVSGGFGTPDRVTRYAYEDPALRSPGAHAGLDEPEQFVGMARARIDVRTDGGAPARLTTRRYAYDASGAPEGRVVEERLYRQEGFVRRLERATANDWEWKPLFGARTYSAQLVSTLARTCLGKASEAACLAQPENVRRTQQTWSPESCGGAAQALYVRSARREGIGAGPGDSDRRTLFEHEVRCGAFLQPEYRVLVTHTVFQQARPGSSGAVLDKRGDTRVIFDAKGMPVRTDESLDVGVVATTRRTFDADTGNLLSLTKPEQGAKGGSGTSTVYGYDPLGLFVRTTVNELGHEVVTTHDVATGALLERRGPNAVSLPSGETIREQETWRIDGLGRVEAHAQSFDDTAAGYVLRTVETTTYLDDELPNRVRTRRLRDVGGSAFVTDEQTVDGLGRVLTEAEHVNPRLRAVTTYSYDGDGNVSAVEVPDPRSDDGARVRYAYGYDGLGRLSSLTRPDGSGLRISYDGLDKIVREVAGDGTGSTRRQSFDALGRLVEVRELYPAAEAGVTRYRYDGRDNVVGITDADGNVTALEHDWASRRVAIRRGDRVAISRADRIWRYTFDLNGNLVTETSPVPPGADPALHTARSRFDDLDRLTSLTYADLPVSTAEGEKAPQSIRYFYDEGRNGVGRLSRVALPFGQVRYQHDARGLVTVEQRSFALSGIATASDSQEVQRTYNALGQLTRSVWDDGQEWRMAYDGRGLVASVDWLEPAAAALQQVAAFDRSLAGQPRVRGSSFGQERRYTYDELGRVVADAILARDGQTVATRGYAFTGSGDLASVSGSTAGVSAAASYTYDAQHRLTRAAGPNGYTGSFTYSPAGNVLTASVAWNGSDDSRNVRYEYGARDPQAVDRLVNRSSGQAYASFRYDLAGNMVERTTPGGTTSLDWDGLDRIRVARTGNGREIYFYDHEGRRMLAVSERDGVRFWFAESETHYRPDGTQTRRYLHLSDGGSALARVENKTKLELQYADALQNLTLALDQQGAVVASFLYGPFGEVVRATGDEEHRRQFNSKENDALTSLRYYGFRYYDPLTLRWNSADPLYRVAPDLGLNAPQRMNLYAFSLNNAVRYFDPDGRWPFGGWGPDLSDPDGRPKLGECDPEAGNCEPQQSEESAAAEQEEAPAEATSQGTAAATAPPSSAPPSNGGILRKFREWIIRYKLGKALEKAVDNTGKDPSIEVDKDGHLEIKGDKQRLEDATKPSTEQDPNPSARSRVRAELDAWKAQFPTPNPVVFAWQTITAAPWVSKGPDSSAAAPAAAAATGGAGLTIWWAAKALSPLCGPAMPACAVAF